MTHIKIAKTTSLRISAFGGVGIVLLLTTHGLWYETAKEIGFSLPSPASLPFEPTMLNCLFISMPVAILAFIVVFLSTRKQSSDQTSDLLVTTIMPSSSFLAVAIGGIIGSYIIPLAFNWVQIMGALCLGGITGFSHGTIIASTRLTEETKVAIQKLKRQRADIMVKWLELEHQDCQSALQWIVWATIIFTTAGLITWYTRPGAEYPMELFNTSVLHALIVVTWSFMGLFFGIMTPIFQRMRFLREQVKNIACETHVMKLEETTLEE